MCFNRKDKVRMLVDLREEAAEDGVVYFWINKRFCGEESFFSILFHKIDQPKHLV